MMPSTRSSIARLGVLLLAFLVVSCGTGGNHPVPPRRPEKILHGWYDDGGPGRVSIRISLPDQIAEIKRGERDIGWCYVATGKEGHGTSAGSYSITEKIEDKYSNRYGWIEDEFGNVVDGDAKPSDKVPEGMLYVPAPMPYWMRLTSYGIGMHGGLIPEPGKPASHGCIRMPKEFVPLLFDAVQVGTPVTITNARSKRSQMMETVTSADPHYEERRIISTRPLTPGGVQSSPESRRYTDPFGGY